MLRAVFPGGNELFNVKAGGTGGQVFGSGPWTWPFRWYFFYSRPSAKRAGNGFFPNYDRNH